MLIDARLPGGYGEQALGQMVGLCRESVYDPEDNQLFGK
jgi:hypothetical protein